MPKRLSRDDLIDENNDDIAGDNSRLIAENKRLRLENSSLEAKLKTLQEREERLTVFMEHNPSLVFLKDERGKYVYINKAYEKQFVGSKDWLGKTDFDIWPRESAELFRNNDQVVLKSGRLHQFLEDSKDFEGNRHCWLCYKFPFTDSQGRQFVGGIGIHATDRVVAEERLQESEQRFRAFIAASSDVVFRMSPDSNKMLYLRRPDFVPDTDAQNTTWLQKYVHPDDQPRVTEAIHKAVQTKSVFELEHRATRVEGTLGWYFSRAVPILGDDGEITEWFGTASDITDRKQAEEALVLSEECLASVVEKLPVGVALLASDGRFILQNSIMAKYAPRHIIPSQDPMQTGHWKAYDADGQCVPPDQWPGARALRGECVNPGMELLYTESNGRERTILVSAVPFKSEKDNSLSALMVLQDITGRKNMEEELRRSREDLELRVIERTVELQQALQELSREKHRLYDVLDTLPVRVCLLTPDYHVPFANRAFREAFGESDGRCCYDYRFGFSAPCSFCEAFKPLETGQPHHWQLESPDGKSIDTHNIPFTDTDGSPMILEMNVDVTEQRRLEEQLRQSHKMEAIGTLAGGIAHDFNNILTAIIGFTEMALDDVSDSLVEKNLGNVINSATRAKELVKQILAFSRKTTYEKIPLALSPIVNETIKLLRASIPATVDITVLITASSDTVIAAPVAIQQIIMNLVTNALLAMRDKRGSIEITLSDINFEPDALTQDGPSREYIQIMVKDNGVGMGPAVMKRAFEPFYTTREVGKGAGMGLSVTYGIVKDLGGTITVESEPEKGSTFRVFLPKEEAKVKRGIRHTQMPHGNERVLFVDDEPLLVEWGRVTLERLGYVVTAVMDPCEALVIFSKDPSLFDLVITDQAMPQMPGLDLCLKLLGIRSDIPIILCTGHSETVSPKKAKEIGIRRFLIKPLTRQEFATAIRKVLNQTA